MADSYHAARDGEEIYWRDANGQDIVSSWHSPALFPPDGRRWGAADICFTRDGDVVLCQGIRFLGCFPAAGPRRARTGVRLWTGRCSRRPVCRSMTRPLLGFAKGECVRGEEEGLVLVRSLWRAEVSLNPWEPQHETTARMIVSPAEVWTYLSPPYDSRPITQRWIDEALAR